ncbi:hypothetical protein CR513_49546, partial [Mucuna pruriens]
MVNALATLLAMIRVNEGLELTLNVQRQSKPVGQIEGEIDAKPWYHNIRWYIKDKEYHDGISENDEKVGNWILLKRQGITPKKPRKYWKKCLKESLAHT